MAIFLEKNSNVFGDVLNFFFLYVWEYNPNTIRALEQEEHCLEFASQ
jgi:hypothetical protein